MRENKQNKKLFSVVTVSEPKENPPTKSEVNSQCLKRMFFAKKRVCTFDLDVQTKIVPLSVIQNDPVEESVAILSYSVSSGNYSSKNYLSFVPLSKPEYAIRIETAKKYNAIIPFPALDLIVLQQMGNYRILHIDPNSKLPVDNNESKFLTLHSLEIFDRWSPSRNFGNAKLTDTSFVCSGEIIMEEEPEEPDKETMSNMSGFFASLMSSLDKKTPQCLYFFELSPVECDVMELPLKQHVVASLRRCGPKLLVGGRNEFLVIDWKNRRFLSHIHDVDKLIKNFDPPRPPKLTLSNIFISRWSGKRKPVGLIEMIQGLLNTNLVIIYEHGMKELFFIDNLTTEPKIVKKIVLLELDDPKSLNSWHPNFGPKIARSKEKIRDFEVFDLQNCVCKTDASRWVYRLNLHEQERFVDDWETRKWNFFVFGKFEEFFVSLDYVRVDKENGTWNKGVFAGKVEMFWGEVGEVGRSRNYGEVESREEIMERVSLVDEMSDFEIKFVDGVVIKFSKCFFVEV